MSPASRPDSPAAPAAAASAPPARRPGTAGSRRSRPRRWLPALLGVFLVLLLIAGFAPRPTPVETAAASEEPLRSFITEEGRTRIRQRYVVSVPVAGQLRRPELRAGAQVEAGRTVVAIIDPIAPALLDARSRSLAEARRDAAAAQMEKARAAVRFATGDLRRLERLHREGSASPQELESFQWREAAAAKELAAAESALRLAEAELAEPALELPAAGAAARAPVQVTAPASGRVLKVFEENARVVSPGLPLLEIGDPADLEVVIEVLSRDGAALPPGTKVELDQWGGSTPLEARVRLVEPAAFTKVSALGVEEQRVNVVADLLSPPDQRPGLGDGFRVEARIVVWETPRTLQVPTGALFRRGADWAVYRVESGRAVLRPVQPGRAGATRTQVLEGLAAGDAVILYPGDRIQPGTRVQPIRIAP